MEGNRCKRQLAVAKHCKMPLLGKLSLGERNPSLFIYRYVRRLKTVAGRSISSMRKERFMPTVKMNGLVTITRRA